MPDVFISYCHEDSDFAEVVRGRVKDAGFTTWMDFEGLTPGVAWSKEIDDAIRGSLALILILSPASVASKYVSYEWAFALGAGVKVIPILLKPMELAPPLAGLQYLDFTQKQARPWPDLRGCLEAAAKQRPNFGVQIPHTAPGIVKEAVAALDNPNQEEMQRAVARLAQMNLQEAKDALVAALKHPLPDVRIEVASTLAKQGDIRALPGLAEGVRVRGRWFAMQDRVYPMGAAAGPALLSYLSDDDPDL